MAEPVRNQQGAETAQTLVVTRYDCKVHASNRNSDYGLPVTVYADNRQDAVERAITAGWGGHRRDARVTFLRAVQEVVVLPAAISCPPGTRGDS